MRWNSKTCGYGYPSNLPAPSNPSKYPHPYPPKPLGVAVERVQDEVNPALVRCGQLSGVRQRKKRLGYDEARGVRFGDERKKMASDVPIRERAALCPFSFNDDDMDVTNQIQELVNMLDQEELPANVMGDYRAKVASLKALVAKKKTIAFSNISLA